MVSALILTAGLSVQSAGERMRTHPIDAIIFPSISLSDEFDEIPEALRFVVHMSNLMLHPISVTLSHESADGQRQVVQKLKPVPDSKVHAPTGARNYRRISLREYFDEMLSVYGGYIEYEDYEIVQIYVGELKGQRTHLHIQAE